MGYWIIIVGFFSSIYKRRWDLKGHRSYVPSSISNQRREVSCLSIIVSHFRNFIDGYIRTILRDIGNVHSHVIRNTIYKHIYRMNISKGVVIYGGSEIRSPERITIGEGSIIGDEAKLDARNGIIIGKYVNLSTGVWIWTEQHEINSPYFDLSLKENKCVVIGNRAWVGSRVTVLPGVHIGEGAVICAGAIVTKDCEPYGVYAGVPARKIGNRNKELVYEFDGKHYMFY